MRCLVFAPLVPGKILDGPETWSRMVLVLNRMHACTKMSIIFDRRVKFHFDRKKIKLCAIDSGTKPWGSTFPGHFFRSRAPKVQKPNTAYPKNRVQIRITLEIFDGKKNFISHWESTQHSQAVASRNTTTPGTLSTAGMQSNKCCANNAPMYVFAEYH